MNDPILQNFLKAWGKIEVERQKRSRVEEELFSKYESLHRKISDYRGYLAEVFMIQVLWNNQKKVLDGKYFNVPEKIQMPTRFIYIEQRRRFGSGTGQEIDIYATAGRNVWVAESKWRKKPVGEDVVNNLIQQGNIVKEKKGEDLVLLQLGQRLVADFSTKQKYEKNFLRLVQSIQQI